MHLGLLEIIQKYNSDSNTNKNEFQRVITKPD